MVKGVVVVAGMLLGGMLGAAHGELAAGTMVDQSTAAEVRDLLPPEIYKHYEKGEYRNRIVEFPSSKFRWDDGFEQATKQNAETLTLDAEKQPVDKTTGKRRTSPGCRSRTSPRTIPTAA